MKNVLWICICFLIVSCQRNTSAPSSGAEEEPSHYSEEVLNTKDAENQPLSLDSQDKEDVESIVDERNFPISFSWKEIVEIINTTDSVGERFEDFFFQFVEDKEFQLSRVRFPVRDKLFVLEKVSDYENETEDPDFDQLHHEFTTLMPLTRENWIYITADYFNESTESFSGLPKGWYKQYGNIIFRNGEYASCAIDYEMEFKKIDNLWYLNEYNNSTLYPADSDGDYMKLYAN